MNSITIRVFIKRAIDKLTENVYITIDLDVFDPSLMPSTGTPEPGGPEYFELMHFLRDVIKKKNVVGFDVVELCPVSSQIKLLILLLQKLFISCCQLQVLPHNLTEVRLIARWFHRGQTIQSSFFASSQITFISSRLIS